MGQVLYRKYRSKSLDELVGQSHITDGLRRSIDAGTISHAYLFTGPRGTGKTSVARILAHMLNNYVFDDPCSHLDIIEIDAASNRRIDEIRDLREKVHIAPTSGKYKVYIIDEVHMLTREAFNALLKTLEEPPAHAIFILATTELHKLPETIVSRTQRYTFKPIEKSKIISHLRAIAKAESITVDGEALDLIAEHADGGFRDAISLLDQIRHGSDKVTAETVATSLGIPPRQLTSELWAQIASGSQESSKTLHELLDQGYHAPRIASELLSHAVSARNVPLAEKLLEVQSSPNPEMKLQLLIIAGSNDEVTKPVNVQKEEQPAAQPLPVPTVAKEQPTKTITKPKLVESNNNVDEQTAAVLPTNEASSSWEKVIESIRENGHSVYGPLRLAEAGIEGDVLKLRLKFPFHIKRIAESQNMKLIAETYEKITGKIIKIDVGRLEFTEAQKIPEPVKKDNEPKDEDKELMSDPLSIVRNVFGNAEVL